jgi:transposase
MQDKQEIILRYYRDGHNKSKISRELGISRRIVRKYILAYEEKKASLEKDGVEIGELIEDIVEPPRYDSRNRKKRKVTEEIVTRVKEILRENQKKRSRGQHKQQLKKIDIHELLHKEGHDIGYSTICQLVNDLEDKSKESFIKQHYDYGEVCEFDWVAVKLSISGELKRFPMAVFTSAKGNHRYGRLFMKEDTQSFQQSHGFYFEYVGGVYREMVYDNMRVAVKKFIGRHEREATAGLLSLSTYYLFGFRFCNAKRGNEKGHVERSGEYLRRKAFGIVDEFDSLESANDHLLDVCNDLNGRPQKGLDGRSANDILAIEKAYLLPLPPVKFECALITESRVDKYSTISVDTCRYSVPDKYVGKIVTTKIYPERIICYFNGEKICEHDRQYGFYQWKISLEHYIETLRRKPGALNGSVALKQSDQKLRSLYERHFKANAKDFIELVSYMKTRNRSIEAVENAVDQLLSLGSMEISTDKIKMVCDRDAAVATTNKTGEIESAAMDQLLKISSLMPGDIRSEGKII